MSKLTVLLASGALLLLIGACSANTKVGSGQPGSTSPTFVSSDNHEAAFIQWTDKNGQLTGSMDDAYIDATQASGISSSHISFTGTRVNDHVVITVQEGLGSVNTLSGDIVGGRLSMQFPQAGGSIGIIVFSPGSVGDYNAAVAVLTADVNAARTTAAQESASAAMAAASTSASAATAQAIANADASLSTDAARLTQDAATLDGDKTLATDIQGMRSDLATEQSEYATVQADACSSAGGSREGDAATVAGDKATVDGDVSTVNGDVTSLQSNSVGGDMTSVRGDLSQLQSLGAPPATDPSPAIVAGNKALQDLRAAVAWAQQQSSGLDGQAGQIDRAAAAFAAKCSN